MDNVTEFTTTSEELTVKTLTEALYQLEKEGKLPTKVQKRETLLCAIKAGCAGYDDYDAHACSLVLTIAHTEEAKAGDTQTAVKNFSQNCPRSARQIKTMVEQGRDVLGLCSYLADVLSKEQHSFAL